MKLFNTMTRSKEEFQPLVPGEVKIYTCGPTVYNFFHIGNARPFVVFDVLRRYFEYRGNTVTFVQNFTDIDDKMISRAGEENITVVELADRFIEEYYKDADALGIKRATVNPRATQHIEEILELISALIEKGYAYATEAGDVYYQPRAFKEYGKLSGQKLDELEEGVRKELNEDKREPADFALWKAQKPGEPAWESPWGMGRPGWHIECSAMSMKYLGPTFDIHCGGSDLVFPHHENEIAQSEGATGEPFARYWMHNGYINVDNQKMSKSAGNFFTVRDIGQHYDLQALRFFLLSAHYRKPVNYTVDLLEQATSALSRLHNAEGLLREVSETGESGAIDVGFANKVDGYRQDFIAAMDDDLNTADALGIIFEMVREINIYFTSSKKREEAGVALACLEELLDVLGLSAQDGQTAIPDAVVAIAEERQRAREAKDWSASDSLRAQIADMGYSIEDGKDGYKIKKA